jgi:CRISPR-associated protein (TIGR03984 family)
MTGTDKGASRDTDIGAGIRPDGGIDNGADGGVDNGGDSGTNGRDSGPDDGPGNAPGDWTGGGARRAGLRWVSAEGVLPALLPAVAGGVALLSSPRAFTVARVGPDGGCTGPDGPVDLVDVFEARAFTPHLELRWVREGTSGRGVVLGEDDAPAWVGWSAGLPDTPPAPALGPAWTGGKGGRAADLEWAKIDYVLWGEPAPGDEQREGWLTLSSARIGALRVPGDGWPAGRPTRLSLRAREYVAVEAEYGNAYVLDERLVEIVKADAKRDGGRGIEDADESADVEATGEGGTDDG